MPDKANDRLSGYHVVSNMLNELNKIHLQKRDF